MYCIGLNGPPRSGKDSIAKEIERHYDLSITPTTIKSLSMPMRLVAFAMLGRPYSVEEYEAIKDEPHYVFNGETLREFMIRYSEEFAKPAYGKDIWGKALTASLGTSIHLPGICIVPDIGFIEETDHLIDAFGPDRFILIHVMRAGYESWRNDSRGWVVPACQIVRVANPKDKLEVPRKVILSACEARGWDI